MKTKRREDRTGWLLYEECSLHSLFKCSWKKAWKRLYLPSFDFRLLSLYFLSSLSTFTPWPTYEDLYEGSVHCLHYVTRTILIIFLHKPHSALLIYSRNLVCKFSVSRNAFVWNEPSFSSPSFSSLAPYSFLTFCEESDVSGSKEERIKKMN